MHALVLLFIATVLLRKISTFTKALFYKIRPSLHAYKSNTLNITNYFASYLFRTVLAFCDYEIFKSIHNNHCIEINNHCIEIAHSLIQRCKIIL